MSFIKSIDNEYKKLGTLSLNIQGFSIDEPIVLDEEAAILNNYYVDENGFVKEFDCTDFHISSVCELEVIGMTSTMVVPETTTPLAAAGVGESSENGIPGIITLTGINFGEGDGIKPPEGHRVKFRTFETDTEGNKIGWIAPFEGDYLKWEDNEIVVKVPSIGYIDDSQNIITNLNKQIAATGAVRVCIDEDDEPCGCFDDTNQELYIPFSARNNVRDNANLDRISSPFTLRNLNTEGGYTFYFGDGFDGNLDDDIFSREKFENALTTWRCNTFVNFDLDESGTHPNPTNPPIGTGLIVMDSTLPIGTVGTTQVDEDICDSFHSVANSFIIRISTDPAWFTGSFPNFLESTILHELGHAHLLLHTCNGQDKIMHPSSFLDPIELSPDDLNGGRHETALGTITSVDCDVNAPMIPLTEDDCFLPVVEIYGKEIAYEVFPNPTNDKVNINFDFWGSNLDGKIVVFNSIGIEQLVQPHIRQNNTLDLSKLSAGVYFIALLGETNKVHFLSKIHKN